MANRDNFFALLGDDDEGVDLMTLVARAEAKAAVVPAPAIRLATADVVAAKQSQRASVDQGRMERDRGKGGRYQRGRGGPLFKEANGNEVEGQGGFTRVYHGNNAGRGGRGRARGVGSRGRGRGFYVERTVGNERHFYNTQNQGQNGDVNENVTAEQSKDSEYHSNRPTRYVKGDGVIGGENQNSGFDENQGFSTVERRNYGGGNRPFRAGRPSGANRGLGGGEYRDENGYDENGYQHAGRGYGNGNRGFRGQVPRHVSYEEGHNKGEEVMKNENAEEMKEYAANGKGPVENNANNGETESGWDMPEVTEAVADGKTEMPNSKKTEEEDRQRRMESEEEEEAKKMTLAEYEKLLLEKRKALEAMRNEDKRIVDEKEFEGMQLVEKKKEEEHFVKLKMDKEKQKKKAGAEKDEKARKSLNISVGYYGGRGRGRGGGQRGGYRAGNRLPDAPKIEDASQFPILGQAVKA